MTTRDRMIIGVVLILVAAAGFWFGLLAPKRKEARAVDGQIAAARQRLERAQASATAAEDARHRYDVDYATIVRLGKAVPADDNVASLVYQLQAAAKGARIDFRSLGVNPGGTPSATTPSAAIGQVANSPSASSGSNGSGAPSASSAASGASNGVASASAAPSTAGQSSTASLPPGAVVGSAGFPTMPFKFVFTGSYFEMEQMLDDINHFVTVRGDRVEVRGRLLSIDGIALQAAPQGFPNVKASISATAYLLSPDQGVTGSATPAGPGAASQPASPATGASNASAAVVRQAP
jgi:hypothetical protein